MFIIAISLFSCDTRKDFNVELNVAPVLKVRRLDNSFLALSAFQTTINDSLKLSQGKYNFEYELTDDEPSEGITKSINVIGNGTCLQSSGSNYIFSFDPQGPGFQSINLNVTDTYGKKASAFINITVFNNVAPIASLSYQKTAVFDPYEYKINASQSIDKDYKFGGKIVKYEFSISPTYQVTTVNNYINYIFPASGNYQVSLRVQDNDSTWSPSTLIYINVL